MTNILKESQQIPSCYRESFILTAHQAERLNIQQQNNFTLGTEAVKRLREPRTTGVPIQSTDLTLMAETQSAPTVLIVSRELLQNERLTPEEVMEVVLTASSSLQKRANRVPARKLVIHLLEQLESVMSDRPNRVEIETSVGMLLRLLVENDLYVTSPNENIFLTGKQKEMIISKLDSNKPKDALQDVVHSVTKPGEYATDTEIMNVYSLWQRLGEMYENVNVYLMNEVGIIINNIIKKNIPLNLVGLHDRSVLKDFLLHFKI
jgi:hypothetical protein